MLKYRVLHPAVQKFFSNFAEDSVRKIGEMYNVPGAAVILIDDLEQIRMHEIFGKPNDSKNVLRSSEEKAIRLYRNKKHKSSWESRIPADGRKGGAIRLPNKCIFAVDGFSEEVDEALAGAICSLFGWIYSIHIEDIMRSHGNIYTFEKIQRRLLKHCLQ